MFARSINLTQPSFIHNEDYISALPDDCLRGIFNYFNHEHLDEVCAVSQRMHDLSAISRSSAYKPEVYHLDVQATEFGEAPRIHLAREKPDDATQLNRVDTMIMTEFKMANKWFDEATASLISGSSPFSGYSPDVRQELNMDMVKHHSIIEKAVFAMNRNYFEGVTFEMVIIDDKFMKTLEKLSHNNSVRPLMARLDFRFCAIYDPAGTGVAKRLLNFILYAQPSVLYLGIQDIAKEVDLDFLRRFASSEFSQKLFSGDGFTTSMTRPVAPSNRAVCAKEDSAKMLSSLENCFCSSVFVDLDWAVCVIFDRLREKAMGNYKFYSERMLDSNDIGRALELDLEHHVERFQRHENHHILLRGTNWIVRIDVVAVNTNRFCIWIIFEQGNA